MTSLQYQTGFCNDWATDTVAKALALDTGKPQYLRDTLAFMFETRRVIRPTAQALDSPLLQKDYLQCWQNLSKRFDPRQP